MKLTGRNVIFLIFIIQIIEALFKTKSKALNHVIKHLFMVTVINA